jgi:hypothetical protein
MMAKGLVLREVAVLVLREVAGSGGGSPAVRGQAPRWNDEKWGSESATPTPIFLLSEAQVQAFQTKPTPG